MTSWRWLAVTALSAAAILGVAGTAVALSRPQVADSGQQSQLDRIDGNAYQACLFGAGTAAPRRVLCTAPPTVPPTTPPPPTTSSAPATTTPPPTSPAGGCAWPACFPTAATTGVPLGVPLTTVSGDVHLVAGATLDSRDVQGSLIIDGDNVHVTRTRVHGVVFNGEHTGTQLTDTEITANPGQSCSTGDFPPITGGSYSLLRVHVHNWQDGPRTSAGTVTITDSLSDGLCFASGEHPDGVQQYGPGSTVHVTLDHDSLSGCAGNSTDKGNSALFWSDHPGPNSTLTAVHDRFACGQFTVRINDTGSGISGNYPGVVADIRDNTVAAGTWQFGLAECANAHAYDGTDGVQWSGNVLDTGQAIASPCT